MDGKPTISNRDFLDGIFGRGGLDGVFVTSVAGPPQSGRFGRSSPDDLDPGNNNYFCVSKIHGDRRVVEAFRSLHVLVVDDVGTKISPHTALAFFGDPTWIVETSPRNFQWGYKLDRPVDDVAVANGLIEALCRAVGTGDVAGVNRLVRLPVGMNLKDTPFQVKLHTWDPDRTLSLTKALTVLSAVPVEPELHNDPFLPADRDPVIHELILRDHPFERTRDPGRYRVQCPWVDTHTGGRDDGAAYMAPAGFKCHHGHCADKTFADFRNFLGLSATKIDAAKREAELESYLVSEGISVVTTDVPTEAPSGVGEGAPTPSPARAPTDWTVKRFHHPTKPRPLRDGDPEFAPFKRHWLFEDVILADGQWMLTGHGGEGKSRLALSLCMSAAAGLPFGNLKGVLPTFRPVNPEGVRTLFVTQEDDESEKIHRYASQWRALVDEDARWEDALEKLGRNLYIPPFDPLDGLSPEIEKALHEEQLKNGAFELVVWDPLIMFFDEDDEHGLNSANGARATLAKLTRVSKRVAKKQGKRTSVGFVHHQNKSGAIMGSAMLSNICRSVFTMERHQFPPPGKLQATMTVMKSNATQLRGKACTVELRGSDATAHIVDDFTVPPTPPEPAPEDKPKKGKKA